MPPQRHPSPASQLPSHQVLPRLLHVYPSFWTHGSTQQFLPYIIRPQLLPPLFPPPGITSLPVPILTFQWPAHPVNPSSCRRPPRLPGPPERVVAPSIACQFCLCRSKCHHALCIQVMSCVLFIFPFVPQAFIEYLCSASLLLMH